MTSMVDGHGTDVPLPTLEEARERRAVAIAWQDGAVVGRDHADWQEPRLFDLPAAPATRKGYHQ